MSIRITLTKKVRKVMQDGIRVVLLVDDDPQVAPILSAYISQKGGIFLSATDVVEGWEVFEKNRDVVSLVIIRVGLKGSLHFVQLLRGTADYEGKIMAKSGLPVRREPFMKPGLCDCETDGPDLLPKIREALGWTE